MTYELYNARLHLEHLMQTCVASTRPIIFEARIKEIQQRAENVMTVLKEVEINLDRARDDSRFCYAVISLDRNPGFACSGIAAPVVDRKGGVPLLDKDFELEARSMSITVVPQPDAGYIVVSWFSNNVDRCNDIYGALSGFGEDGIASVILMAAFNLIENSYLSVELWTGLAPQQQSILLGLSGSSEEADKVASSMLGTNILQATAYIVLQGQGHDVRRQLKDEADESGGKS